VLIFYTKILIIGLFLQIAVKMVKKNLCGLTADEIYRIIQPWDFNYSHTVAISNNIYKKRIAEIDRFKNIPKQLTSLLMKKFNSGLSASVNKELSSDGTEKYLYKTSDSKMFETVFIPGDKRNTVCISSQSGCRMGCSFCATAAYGFHGNLSAGEIVSQVISIPVAARVTHVVFMGMGEPMDNLDNVLKACDILTSEWGLSLSPRNITVSTVGITPGIEKFLETSECNLALSLFSPFPEERIAVIPAEVKYPVRKILELLKNYPVKKSRRLSLAYVMINDLNDTDRHLSELKSIVAGSGLRVNLIPYHPAAGDLKRSSTPGRMMFFKHDLVISGISASIRKSRGADISAACGLLAAGLK
jgi:23S rRNA (adenine2503-C2)-methyltransferase